MAAQILLRDMEDVAGFAFASGRRQRPVLKVQLIFATITRRALIASSWIRRSHSGTKSSFFEPTIDSEVKWLQNTISIAFSHVADCWLVHLLTLWLECASLFVL